MDSKCLFFAAIFFCCMLSFYCLRPAYAAQANDPCSLVTQAQVGAVLGVNVEAAQRIAPRLCQWSAHNQPNSINAKKVALTISDEQAFRYAKAPVVSNVKTMPGSGICDDAVYTVLPGVTPGLGTSLYVKKRSSYFVVHVYGFPEQTKVMEMEKTLALEACSKL